MKSTLSSQTLRMAVLALEAMGLDASSILSTAGISRAKLSDPTARIPVEQELRFWTAAQRSSSDPLLALRMAGRVPAGAFPLLEYIGSSCRSIHQSLALFVRYSRVVHGSWRSRLLDDAHGVRLELGGEAAPEQARCTTEFALAVMARRLRDFVGGPLPLSRVTFRHRPAGPLRAYREAFGAPALFRHESDGLVFERSIKTLPPRQRDHLLLGALLGAAEKLSQSLPEHPCRPESALIARVEAAVSARLPHGAPRVELVAEELATSGRSLQRRLESEGTSVKAITAFLRKKAAAELLKRRDLSNEEVALALGYSTLSAFSRAFKGWFEMAPSHYRKTL